MLSLHPKEDENPGAANRFEHAAEQKFITHQKTKKSESKSLEKPKHWRVIIFLM